jgi:magnesium-transporting ATPase (P-type)
VRRGSATARTWSSRIGIVRGQDITTLVLLCVSTAIASIPVGLPTFVQTMLSSGAQRLAAAKAVVKSLSDVETLGGTTVINSDKTGTLTMNAMTATTNRQLSERGLRVLAFATRELGTETMTQAMTDPMRSSPTSSSSRWSASWTRCAPRPGTPSAPHLAPGSTCG